MALEEGKNSVTTAYRINPSRVFPLRLLQFFLVFLALGLGVSLYTMYTVRYSKVQNMAHVPRPIIALQTLEKPQFEEDRVFSLESWIKPPSKLMHNMSDPKLLWRASFVPQIKTYPFKRVPKIAFMFLTKGPLPLAPLWERFFKGHEGLYSIYVHSMPLYEPDFASSSVFYNRQIPSQLTEWGMMNMCDAERRLLANALLDLSNEWFVLLSESCIPLTNMNIIHRYLSRSRHSFVSSFDEDSPYGRGRYNERMAPEVNLTEWRKGSQWFEVSRLLAVKIVGDTKYYRKFKDFCRPHCYVDEHYFQTMLAIETPRLLANRSLTFVDWSRGGAHPATFGRADVTEDFFKRLSEGQNCIYNHQPTSLCFLFARKFAPSALEPLLELGPDVLGF